MCVPNFSIIHAIVVEIKTKHVSLMEVSYHQCQEDTSPGNHERIWWLLRYYIMDQSGWPANYHSIAWLKQELNSGLHCQNHMLCWPIHPQWNPPWGVLLSIRFVIYHGNVTTRQNTSVWENLTNIIICNMYLISVKGSISQLVNEPSDYFAPPSLIYTTYEISMLLRPRVFTHSHWQWPSWIIQCDCLTVVSTRLFTMLISITYYLLDDCTKMLLHAYNAFT